MSMAENNNASTLESTFNFPILKQLAKANPIAPKEPEEKKLPSRRASIIREFFLNTSTHGLPGIARSRSVPNCFFWCISLASFTGFMLYLIIDAILNYLQYPTQMDISIVGEWPQYFPAVSLCNIGGLRADKFIPAFLNFTNALNLTNTNDTSRITADQVRFITYFMQYAMNLNQSMIPYYFPLPSMLYYCRYNGQTCATNDFTLFTIGSYGLCHTFNARLKNNSRRIRYGHDFGGDGKLELGLYIHSHQYIPYMTYDYGAAVLVHDNSELPLVDTYGIHLQPGQKHKLSYRKQASYFLPAPYTACVEEPPFPMDTVLENYPQADYAYSQGLCYRYAIQVFTYQVCGCINPFVWDVRHLQLPVTKQVVLAPLCHVMNPCYSNASRTYMSEPSVAQGNSSYDCPQRCSNVNFLVEKSSSAAPLEWEMGIIKEFVENSTIPLASNWSNTWRTQIRENYIAITLLRESNVVENRTQSASLGLVDILSNIGGQMGLWIGISLLSFMELLEMLFRLIRYECFMLYAAWQRKKQVQTA